MNPTKHFSQGALIVIAMTFLLFTVALFTAGFTHDLLLEAGVFLVSVKLMLMTYRNSISANRVEKKLDEISASLDKLISSQPALTHDDKNG